MLNWILGKKENRKKGGKRKIGKKPSYEKSKKIAAGGNAKERKNLAAHDDLEPEILYYFASDGSKLVRLEVAENPGTPLQADLVLARDEDEDIRCELAGKIGRLVPQLTPDESVQLTEMALEVLEVLAKDTLPRVRAIIAQELKRADNVPKHIIRTLAEDLEDIVSVPILQYSPMLNNEDLIQIIARGVNSRSLFAVALRKNLAEPVVDAVVATKDSGAINGILDNKSAQVGADTFDIIAAEAEQNPEWHNAMVYRDDLPVRTILRIASFVSAALMEALIELNESQKPIVEELRKTVRERIERGDLVFEGSDHVSAQDRVAQAFKEGVLDEKRLEEALDQKDFSFARYGIALLADLPSETVNKMLNSGAAKAIVALAWKAKLSMDMAEDLQRSIGRIQNEKIITPLDDGSYPLSKNDIDWYMANFFE